jgi:hypothetical protein
MSKTTELFSNRFMLTGEQSDPRDLDFSLFTHEEVINNPGGDPDAKNYYMDYNLENDTFIDLAVKCRFSYITQPVLRRIETIEWYFEDGTIGATRTLVQVTNM